MEASKPNDPPPGKQPKPATGEQPAAPHSAEPHERIDGLRAWLAQVDRKLGIRTYAFAAAIVLALAAAGIALVFALQLQEDSATKDGLQNLRAQIGAAEQSASEAAQEDLQSLSDRVGALEGQVSSLRDDQGTTSDELRVAEDDIEELRGQIDELESSDSNSSGGTGAN